MKSSEAETFKGKTNGFIFFLTSYVVMGFPGDIIHSLLYRKTKLRWKIIFSNMEKS